MTAEMTTGAKVWRVFGNILKFLLRLIFVLVLGAALGVGLYIGVPWAYHSLISPVRDNQARIAAIEQRLDQERSLQGTDLSALQERVTQLEVENTALREASTVQAQDFQAALERIQRLEQRITAAEGELGNQQTALDALQADLTTALDGDAAGAQAMQAQLGGFEGRLALLQTAQDLLKVRLMLLEENPRGARDTLLLASAHLERAAASLPELAETVAGLQTRLGELDGLIAANSYRVGVELEALWAEVMDLVAPGAEMLPVQPATSPLLTPTVPVTPTLTLTPTPPPTPTLTPTP